MIHLADLPEYLLKDVGPSRAEVGKLQQAGETLR
jgi:hypothetical protein